MKVLVTGATGFIGRHLVCAALGKGWLVRAAAFRSKDTAEFERMGAEIFRCDLTRKEELKGILKDVDIVFHLAAQLGRKDISSKRIYTVNIEGTRNLLNECVNSSIKAFIHGSASGVIGVRNYVGADETASYAPKTSYEVSKCKSEKLVLEYFNKYELPVTIIRPQMAYGPGDLHKLKLFRAINNRRFYLVGNGEALWHPSYIDDVVESFILAAGKEPAGEIFNIAGPRYISVKEFTETIAECLGKKLPRLRIPTAIAYTGAFCLETVLRILKKEPVISISKVRFLTTNFTLNISKAKSLLGYKPQVDPVDGIKKTVKWYKDNGYL
ncbi:MAG: NAD-dependent epimerase/dehydratase family protein [Sedimentisphaerales bacterium]|nr:NAD-dependent epimerase/dehydratase family protein [Sedimentisphaerales bacterium]